MLEGEEWEDPVPLEGALAHAPLIECVKATQAFMCLNIVTIFLITALFFWKRFRSKFFFLFNVLVSHANTPLI